MPHEYTWNEERRGQRNPALEPHFRQLVITAVTFLEMLTDEERLPPAFSGGRYASPKNETGHEMWNALEAALAGVSSDVTPTGVERAEMFTLAIRAAFVVRAHGFGQRGWQNYLSTLAKVRAPAPPAPTPAPDAPPAPVADQPEPPPGT